MKNYSISAKEAKQMRRNEYKDMVAKGLAISNWSATHMPYSNKTINNESNEREEELLNSLVEFEEEAED